MSRRDLNQSYWSLHIEETPGAQREPGFTAFGHAQPFNDNARINSPQAPPAVADSGTRSSAGRGTGLRERLEVVGMTAQDDPQTSGTIITAIVGAVLIFALIVALQAMFYIVEENERYNKVYTQAPEDLTRLRAEQQERINSYRWIDQANGIASIPVERAMELMLAETYARETR